jgi:membrane fusion protein (multidrug efflux system)
MKDAIVIPQESTYDIQDKIFVFKVINGQIKSFPIEIMPYNDGQNYVVISGLESGDSIISEGAGLMRDRLK